MVSDEAVRAIAAGVLTTQAGELTGSQIAQAMARELLVARPVVDAARGYRATASVKGAFRRAAKRQELFNAVAAHDAAVGQGEGGSGG